MTQNSTNPEQQKSDIQSQTQLIVSSNNSIRDTSNVQSVIISTAVVNRDASQLSLTTATAAECAKCLFPPPITTLPPLTEDNHHEDTDILNPQAQKPIKEQKAKSQRQKRLSKLQADALKGNELPLEKRRTKLPASSDKPQSEGISQKKSAHSTSNTSSRQSLRACSNSEQLTAPACKISQNGKKIGHYKNGVTISSDDKNLYHQNQKLNVSSLFIIQQIVQNSEMADDYKPNLKIKNNSQGILQNKEDQNMAKFTTTITTTTTTTTTAITPAVLKTPERSTKNLNKLNLTSNSTHNSPFLVSRDPTNRGHRQKCEQLNNKPHQKPQPQIQSFRLPSKSQLKSRDLLKSQSNQANQAHISEQDFDCSPKKCGDSSSQSSSASPQQAMLMGESIVAKNQERGSSTCVKKTKRDFVTPSRTPQPKSRTLLNSASNSTDFATPLPGSNGKSFNSGRWKKDEHKRFLEALKEHGREWKLVQQHVSTRSSTQARSHAQKFLSKLEKKNIKLQVYLQSWDPNNSDDNLMSDDEKQDSKLVMQKSGSFLNSQQRKRMSKDQITERQEMQCNFMLRGHEMPPRLLKQRSSPMLPNDSLFVDRQQYLEQFERFKYQKNFGDYEQPDQGMYARESSNILQSLNGVSKNLSVSGKKRLSRQTKQGGKENSQMICSRQSITPPTPPLQSRRKSIISNQTEDDRRSINSLFPPRNLEMQRRKSCKDKYSQNQGLEFDVDSPQVTSKKSRGQKNKYHKIRISNIHQQQTQDDQYHHPSSFESNNNNNNSFQQQYTSEYQRNGAHDSNYLPEYQIPRYTNGFTMPLTPQPINRSLLNHRKNCIPLNNGNGYQHVSTPPPPEPPHFQSLILPPTQQQSTHEPSSNYQLLPSQSRAWIQMQNKPDYENASFDHHKSQDVISAIPAINSNYQYSIPPPPPASYQYFIDPMNGRNYQSIVRRGDEEDVDQDSQQQQSAEDEQQEADRDEDEQVEINQRKEDYLHHHKSQQIQSQYSQQYANRYRQDLGILRTSYSRNYSNVPSQANPLSQDLGPYYPSPSQHAQQYMNFQLNNPYHQHHLHQFQQQQNQLIDSSSSLYNPQYIMGLNNSRNHSNHNNNNNINNNSNNQYRTLGPDDSYPIMHQQQQQQQQQYISRERGHSFSDIPQGFKIPSNLNPTQRNSSNNNNGGDDVEDATDNNINAARSSKFLMMIGQDETAINPYRAAYQGEYGNNLLEQYKFMQDEIAVREH